MDIIDAARLDEPAVKDYLTNADRRVIVGVRFLLELFNMRYPEYLNRKPAGRPLAKQIMADFRRDNPETLHEATVRKAGGYK